jgi:hypothetical protein
VALQDAAPDPTTAPLVPPGSPPLDAGAAPLAASPVPPPLSPAAAVDPLREPNAIPGLQARAEAHVFFSGHSLLDDPVAEWVELIATSRGDRLGWQQQIVIGSPIRVRTKGTNKQGSGWPGFDLGKSKQGDTVHVLQELTAPAELPPGARYDTLVIAERNDFFSALRWEQTVQYLGEFHQRLTAENPTASSALFQVWPALDRAAPQAWVAYVRQELLGWECVAQRLNLNLEEQGLRAGIAVVPAGWALATLVERALAGTIAGLDGSPSERLDQLFADKVHLAPLGAYFIAAINYAALFGKSPVGAAAPALDVAPFNRAPTTAATASALQELATALTTQYAASPRPWNHTMAECRERLAYQVCPAYAAFSGASDSDCPEWAEPGNPF